MSIRSYQNYTIYEKSRIDKRHPSTTKIVRSDIICASSPLKLVELISVCQNLTNFLPADSLEIHLNHSLVTGKILERFAETEGDTTRLKRLLQRHSKVKVTFDIGCSRLKSKVYI